MEIKFEINEQLKDISINVSAPSITEEVSNVLKALEECKKEKIYALKEGEVYEIKLSDIICFFTDDKNVYLKTSEGQFRTRYRMYEIEEEYEPKFLRVSNAVIVNTAHVKCFNIAQIDNVIVQLDDGTKEYVSKRRIPMILKRLKERGI